MSTVFIIPCAINNSTDSELALKQALHTLESVRELAPKATTALVEHSLKALEPEQKNSLLEAVALLAEYQQNPRLLEIEKEHGIVKANAAGLIAALAWFFGLCQRDNLFQQTKHIVILQAGTTLDANTLNNIESNDNGKFIFAPPENTLSQDQPSSSIGMRFNTALWSFPSEQLDNLMQALWQSVEYAFERIQNDAYTDLGLALYKHLDSKEIFYIKNLCQQHGHSTSTH